MTEYYRPILMQDPVRQEASMALAGGWCWFDCAERLTRAGEAEIVPLDAIPTDIQDRLTRPRSMSVGLSWDAPRLMGIVNVTPDSFSDGGKFLGRDAAVAHGVGLFNDGADLLDIGGESTRPGAAEVSVAEEIERTIPVIQGLAGAVSVPMSIDTRKAAVAEAALGAGAQLLNDVSALTFDDPGMAGLAARTQSPICLMHAQGDPATMQTDPKYENVLLDVYDFLENRLVVAEAAGIARDRVIVDPGIGFGKTVEHNVALIRGLSLFHGLGCVIMLGASRKRFIGSLGAEKDPQRRGSGSIAAALHAAGQGVQLFRVHDVAETRQALAIHGALLGKRWSR